LSLIMVVDDSWLQRATIAGIVRAGGHTVVEAEDGRKAIELLASVTPDCICLDLLMPNMDGFQVLEAMGRRVREIPVIVLTADIQTTTTARCLEYGAVAVSNKPINGENLLRLLKGVLADKGKTG